MDLRCRKTNCKYNDKLLCRKKGILVDEKTYCDSYEPEKGKGYDFSSHIFKEAPEFCGYKHLKKFNLICDAPCIFNVDHKCIANGITINDIKDKPKCIIFLNP